MEESKKETEPKEPTKKSVKKSKKPKIKETTEKAEINFSDMDINQDDLWFLFRLKFGKGTKLPKKELLPKFTEVFNRNLEGMKE